MVFHRRNIGECVTKNTKLIVINSPCNPTGGVYTKETFKEIADIAVDNNILVLSDEYMRRSSTT